MVGRAPGWRYRQEAGPGRGGRAGSAGPNPRERRGRVGLIWSVTQQMIGGRGERGV